MNAKSWFVYLIECQDGSIYTGITVDVEARYLAHAKGTGAKYTRSHPPKALLGVVEYANRSDASKAESKIKRLSAKEKRKFSETCIPEVVERSLSENGLSAS